MTKMAREITIGMRVCGGEGEDYDEGRVLDVDGDSVLVGWDSGTRCWVPAADLSAAA